MGNALHTPGAPGVGVVSPAEARLDDAGLIAVQGPTLLDTRTGVLVGPGSTALLTGTADTAPMTVAIAAHHWVGSRQASDGVYRGANEQAGRKVTIGAAPGVGLGTRIDVVYEKQGDPQSTVNPGPTDATAAPVYGVKAGTPGGAKPTLSDIPGAVELGTVSVAPGAVSTNGANVSIANTARQTVARGAPIPVFSQAERDAITPYPGLQVIRLDTPSARVETRLANGRWTYPAAGLLAVASYVGVRTVPDAFGVLDEFNLPGIVIPHPRLIEVTWAGSVAYGGSDVDRSWMLYFGAGIRVARRNTKASSISPGTPSGFSFSHVFTAQPGTYTASVATERTAGTSFTNLDGQANWGPVTYSVKDLGPA